MDIQTGTENCSRFRYWLQSKSRCFKLEHCHVKEHLFSCLYESIKDELATLDELETLEELINQTIWLDNRIRSRTKERNQRTPLVRTLSVSTTTHSASSTQNPKQIGHTRLTPEERQKRIWGTLFVLWVSWPFHCPLSGSFKLPDPPVKARRLADYLQKEKSPRLLFSATLVNNNQSIPLSVLINSGCEQNLIDSYFRSANIYWNCPSHRASLCLSSSLWKSSSPDPP